MIARDQLMQRVNEALKRNRVVVLLGPRQCGKTTLARQIVPAESPKVYFRDTGLLHYLGDVDVCLLAGYFV